MKNLILTIILICTALSNAEYLGSHPVDKALSFPANTHNASTGVATDAAAVPVYRVYEDNDDVIMAGITGNMALRDSANTAGQYRATITLSAANGFEVGKSYTIRITATVDSVEGGMDHYFQVIAAVATAAAQTIAQNDLDTITGVAGAKIDRGTGPGQLDISNGNLDGTVGSVVADVVTDAASRTASKADVSGLSTSTELATHDTDLKARTDRNAFLTESQEGYHTFQGDLFYVDPVNGDTHANGNRGGLSDPYLTIQDCHDNAVTAWAHDGIILLAGDTNSNTTHTVAATTTINKAYTFIRGPGRDFIITRTGNGDTIEIAADGVELSGVQIGTAATGAGDGISITDADFTRIRNCWILDTRGDGIRILRGDNGQFHDNHFEGTGVNANGQGMHIVGTSGTSNDNVIRNNHFAGVQGTAILIEDGTTNDTSIHHNQIHNSGGWGVDITASSVDSLVHDNFFGNNASGDINDNGTTTVAKNNEQWGHWDELLTASIHNTPTSAGRRLRDLSTSVIITGTSPDTNGTTNSAILIELNGDASGDSGAYDPSVISIVGGTGMGQSRQIWEYTGGAGGDGLTKLAYVNRDWKVVPDDTSEYVITGDPGLMHVNEGLAQGGSADTIILNTLASSEDNHYNDQIVFISAGVGQDQMGFVESYDGASQTATMVHSWGTEPTSESMYAILPMGTHSLAETATAVWGFALEDARTANEVMNVIAAVLSGKSEAGGGTMTFYAADGTTPRLVVTVVAGARTSVDTWDGN